MEQYRPGDRGSLRASHNQTARIAVIATTATAQIPFENRRVQRTADIPEDHARRLVVMLGHFGEIAKRLEKGDSNYDVPIAQLANACTAWLAGIEAERAR